MQIRGAWLSAVKPPCGIAVSWWQKPNVFSSNLRSWDPGGDTSLVSQHNTTRQIHSSWTSAAMRVCLYIRSNLACKILSSESELIKHSLIRGSGVEPWCLHLIRSALIGLLCSATLGTCVWKQIRQPAAASSTCHSDKRETTVGQAWLCSRLYSRHKRYSIVQSRFCAHQRLRFCHSRDTRTVVL